MDIQELKERPPDTRAPQEHQPDTQARRGLPLDTRAPLEPPLVTLVRKERPLDTQEHPVDTLNSRLKDSTLGSSRQPALIPSNSNQAAIRLSSLEAIPVKLATPVRLATHKDLPPQAPRPRPPATQI